MKSVELILEERIKQIEKHGFDLLHDVYNNRSMQLQKAARKLLVFDPEKLEDFPPSGFPLEMWVKLIKKNRKERLIIAGALIAAEIDIMEFYDIED